MDKANDGLSLFGSEDVTVVHPPLPKTERWAAIEKLNKERELVGIYLSAHPLDEYAVVLENMCNTHCSEIHRDADLKALEKRGEVTFGGMVTAVNERFSQRTGLPFGIVTIEDFAGVGELTLFGQDWLRWKAQLGQDFAVFVQAKCVQRFRNSDALAFRVESVSQLYDVKRDRLKKITVSLPIDLSLIHI